MKNIIYKTVEELLEKTNDVLKKPFGEIDKYGRLSNAKGSIGHVIEESHFEYSINSDSKPDFDNLEIECKVTPFIFNKKNEIKAKERLVLNIINYVNEDWNNLYSSSFWKKNKKILMLFYEYDKKAIKELWYIDNFFLYEYPSDDFEIIRQDWEIISNKVKAGKAHELSESDTLYLAACTKGSTAEKSYRKQPFSNILAKQRAYSFKPSFMTYILNTYVYNTKKPDEKIITDSSKLKEKSFYDIILDCIIPFYNMNIVNLAQKLNVPINKNNKQFNRSIIRKIFKLQNDLEKTEEFQKANILIKTIYFNKYGVNKESISFPAFNFEKEVASTWEESNLFNTLSTTKFLFFIFNEQQDGTIIFSKAKFWNMPEKDLDIVKLVWENTMKDIKEGPILLKKGNKISNNFIKKSNNMIAHVRPHSAKAAYYFPDTNETIGDLKNANRLPDGRYMTTQCFWLNNDYIKKILID